MKFIKELDESIDFDKLRDSTKYVLDNYHFHPHYQAIGMTCKPGETDRLYEAFGNGLDDYPEFAVEFIDTYFFDIWEKYDCNKMTLHKINPTEIHTRSSISVNYLIIPIDVKEFYLFWSNELIGHKIENDKIYIINSNKPHYWLNGISHFDNIFLGIGLTNNSPLNKLME